MENTEVRDNSGTIKVTQNQRVEEEKRKNLKRFEAYGGAAILFGILFSLVVYNNQAGVSYVVLMIGAILCVHYALWKKQGLPKRGGKMLFFYEAALILLSISLCTTASWRIQTLDFLAMILLAASYIVHCFMEDRDWSIVDQLRAVGKVMLLPLAHMPEPFSGASAYLEKKSLERKEGKKSDNLAAVLLGLVIAVPILLVVVGLLYSADLVFADMIQDIVGDWELADLLMEFVWRAFLLLFAYVVFFTVVSALQAGEVNYSKTDYRTMNPVTAITFMSLVAAVYVLFSGIQLIALVGRAGLPEGVTYAEYAHEGFYQLVVVCVINLILVTFVQHHFKANQILRAILTVVCGCTYIMIASSAMRMILYIEQYLLTFLRVFVLWFLVVLVILLTTILIGIYRSEFPVYRICLVSMTVLYLAFALLHPDYWVARIDLQYGGIDEYYLEEELSEDAVPAYVNATMYMHYMQLYNEDPENEKDTNLIDQIRTFNVMEYIADRYYEEYL